MVKLVGYSSFVSKKGTKVELLHIVKDLTDLDKRLGAVGQRVDSIFAPEHKIGTFKPSDIGKEVELFYDISDNRAFLRDIIVK